MLARARSERQPPESLFATACEQIRAIAGRLVKVEAKAERITDLEARLAAAEARRPASRLAMIDRRPADSSAHETASWPVRRGLVEWCRVNNKPRQPAGGRSECRGRHLPCGGGADLASRTTSYNYILIPIPQVTAASPCIRQGCRSTRGKSKCREATGRTWEGD